jgi:hypothetical protein
MDKDDHILEEGIADFFAVVDINKKQYKVSTMHAMSFIVIFGSVLFPGD